MKDKSIRVIFWAMVAFFIIIILTMFVGVPLSDNFPVAYVSLPGIAVFLILGVTLLVLTVKKKVEGKLKKFLLLTGASAVGLPVFAVLHNVVSALFNTEEAVFFTIATLVCPLGFLVGAIGTIVLASKNKPGVPAGTS
jgi:putative Ca2+/H+ antiporter (TMEM165/GDT1 family)